MDLVPVSDQSKNEQHERNQEQSGGFRRIHSMAVVPMFGLLLGLLRQHAPIVSPPVALWLQKATSFSTDARRSNG